MKERYIKQVSKLLAVPRNQKKDILRDLEEAFASAKEHGETEEQVIERLGTPEEFAAGMSEVDASSKKMTPKKFAAIICTVVVIVAVGTLAWLYAPILFRCGNPIPYLKAAKLLTEDNHFAVVEDKNADGLVLITDHPCHDVLGYVYQTYGVAFDGNAGDTYIFVHGSFRNIKTVVETETFLDKYIIWNIPPEITELRQNHDLLDEPYGSSLYGASRHGSMVYMWKDEIVGLLGEPDEVLEDGGEVYINCDGYKVTIYYDSKNYVWDIKQESHAITIGAMF